MPKILFRHSAAIVAALLLVIACPAAFALPRSADEFRTYYGVKELAPTDDAWRTAIRRPELHAVSAAPPSVDAFLKTFGIIDIALSPDGAWLAVAQNTNHGEHIRALMVYRVTGSQLTPHKGSTFENAVIANLAWANDDRFLATLQRYDPKTGSALTITRRTLVWNPPQVVSFDHDLDDPVLLLKDEQTSGFAIDKSRILHWLPADPRQILMQTIGIQRSIGVNIYKVNVYDGTATLVERGGGNTIGWMVDGDGQARLRQDVSNGVTTYHARNPGQSDWFEIARFRRREVPNMLPMAFSPDPDLLYALARQGGDRLAIYEYRMNQRAIGQLVFAHPKVDVTGIVVTQPGDRLVGFHYVIHKPQIHFLDEGLRQFSQKLERSFGASNYARPTSVTRDGRQMLITVTGPKDPGAFYLYDAAAERANMIGAQTTRIVPEQMGEMKPIVYKARDGLEINAYLTTPPGNPPRPPLVVMPHGGPEVRDYLEWDPWVQFLATRGYAVLQPNFRGSDGFGSKFAQAGYRQWGLKMQDDITDGVRHLVSAGLVDPDRICIVGASYGGYAALAGAAFTPDLYQCAASINGVADLYDMMTTERSRPSAYHYWRKAVGDLGNREDAERMKRLSPTRNVDKIKIPILLIAGAEDDNVKTSQSRDMVKALKAAGKPHEYIEFEKEGHTIVQYENQKRMYEALESFLGRNIGATSRVAGANADSVNRPLNGEQRPRPVRAFPEAPEQSAHGPDGR